MSKWEIIFTEIAQQDLLKITKATRKRIINKLEWLEDNFDEVTPLTLSNEWGGFYKLRVGDYRIIYSIEWENQIITIEAMDHRSKIYKRK